MKRIPLTKGKSTIVDDADFDWLCQWKWLAMKSRNSFYAARFTSRKSGKRKIISMHRQILNAQLGDEIDHHNGCSLDNRRTNIRFCTHRQNTQNQITNSGTSKYKGVSWHKKSQKWMVGIGDNGKTVYLGLFDDEVEAAKTYDTKAKELFGQFARPNFKD